MLIFVIMGGQWIHGRQPRHLVDDLIHQLFHRLRQIAVGFLARYGAELFGEFPDHLFRLWVDAGHFPHCLRQFQHGFPRFRHQLVAGFAFLLVDVQQLLSENLVGQRGLDLADTVFGQVRLIQLCRPRHHVDMGMVSLVMERCVPAKVLRRDLHPFRFQRKGTHPRCRYSAKNCRPSWNFLRTGWS